LYATILDLGIPPGNVDLARVFSKEEALGLPKHGPQDLAIDLCK
jgi:hypothetical protein